MSIRETLFFMQDPDYREFQAKLIPGVDRERVIGVRVPQLRSYARTMTIQKQEAFLSQLPHIYYEENNLHAFLLNDLRDFDLCLEQVERFLPYVDNWATCDGLRPKCFEKNKKALAEKIQDWLSSEHPYTVRFAIEMLLVHFLDADFDPAYLSAVASVYSKEYYVNMIIAWYFATALAKQYDAALPFLTGQKLPVWVHNKTIQKALESFRIAPEQKAYLKTLKR